MRTSKVVTKIALLVAALSAAPALVYAHGRGGGACRQDIEQLCPSITPGPGAFQAYHQCLEDNASKLSPACQQERSRWQAKVQQTLQACQTDIQSLCSSAGSDTHAIFKCLHENRDNLSQECRDQLPHRHHHHHHHHRTPTPAS
ncbi:MAG TPA: hypothetical protein VMW17_14920 [Candidatus Binatia bacterium]|nr:hypothetical protein [Candidatus Binatia bacterium]